MNNRQRHRKIPSVGRLSERRASITSITSRSASPGRTGLGQCTGPSPGEAKDSAQVRALAGWFAAEDAAGRLAAFFAGDPALAAEERATVEREEGWVLGVVSGTRRPPRNAPRSG